MTATNGAGAAGAASASDNLCLPLPVRGRADRLADLMADGATLTGAANRMKCPLAEIEALWAGICRSLGRQAS